MPNRSDATVITPKLLRDWPLPVPGGGKRGRGTVLVVGGSRYTPGAALLAGVAALRAGAGVLQLAVAESTAAALSIQVPEAMVVGLPETADGSVVGDIPRRLLDLAGDAQVIVVGPGLDNVDETETLLHRLLDTIDEKTMIVLDAYALGALSRDPNLLVKQAGCAVLTPNSTEAAFLLGSEPGDDPADNALRIAERYRAVTSLQSHIAAPDGRIWREESGDNGLGTSGSGDVLAGIIAGLLSRSADPAQAACWGAYTHAASGQRLASRFGRIGFLARELVDEVSHTIAGI
jgi:ADP-dependent NAD(P)H-hydrate dehydratase